MAETRVGFAVTGSFCTFQSVFPQMKLLCEKGYVYEDGKHLYLTKEGKAYAETVYEKHCIIRGFLQKLGVGAENAEEDACRMEHLVSSEAFEKMKEFLEKE